ncbi:MAG: acetolactate synthase large subunit [candidate division Zixibacteria bacterium]|nr:acetolactate synthase large subunit [candidate division Zixibacteria bacterium]NIR65114.1 acetolactate synthase large subunit [candidate division Zixibacteria bacterium]NIS17848.1 acetolactate synthase large subunit [candidate division Zixibacteria bacterium]NIS46858.1 acetolactate synthase large subunit [candidate division Zixibacteria bacterium]NIT54570.1 acetolactate synthase large subunit [candidate division Zixibacteria bacterium]
MKVSDLIVKCLETEGVKYVFGLPGEENEDLLFSLENSSIQFIPTRMEQGASFMADVYGRLTGKAGVCLSTLGPGATNLITGIADAHLDKSPLVAITGQGSSDRIHKESHQYVDIVNMFKPITKWNTSIQNPMITTEVVRKAFKLAEMEKPGATHFELPEDVAALNCDLEPLKPVRLRRPAPDYKAMNGILERLKFAKKPLILAGNGAIRKMASKHLREFVKLTGIPVVSTFMGKGAVSDFEENSLYAVGLQARDHAMKAIDEADLIIAVGYDIAEYAPEHWNGNKDNKIVHIDFTPAEVYEFYHPELEIVCDISAVFWELNIKIKAESVNYNTEWYKPIRKAIRDDLESYKLKGDHCFTIPGALHIIRNLLNPGDILISDVGAHKMWIGRNYPVHEPNSVIISNGLASMGIALPGGIAAKLAHPDKKVVAAMGDGGFLMNAQEIETARRIGVNYTIIVFNDNDYGLISWKQVSHTGRKYGTQLTNPDFKKYAESFGIKGYSPSNLEELHDNLKEAIMSDELSLVEIGIDPSVNYELTQKLQKNRK